MGGEVVVVGGASVECLGASFYPKLAFTGR
jgi:hypothetical protein